MSPKQLCRQQQDALADAPALYTPVLRRAYGGASKAAAIKAFCLACTGFVRADVKSCTAPACPLWPYRPYQSDNESEAE